MLLIHLRLLEHLLQIEQDNPTLPLRKLPQYSWCGMLSHSAFLFPSPPGPPDAGGRSVAAATAAGPINPMRSRADAHEAGLRMVRRFFLGMTVETTDDARLESEGPRPARSARKLRPLAHEFGLSCALLPAALEDVDDWLPLRLKGSASGTLNTPRVCGGRLGR
mmetsp:Transcript_1128/g.2664  ORF Transcript_1128/g.2664 Transcript_1128/m.2664 type:complete len:164 (-) Transcript_1128:368-859(-)